MNVDGNTSYKIGNAFGNGIYVDSANQLSLTNNLTYNIHRFTFRRCSPACRA